MNCEIQQRFISVLILAPFVFYTVFGHVLLVFDIKDVVIAFGSASISLTLFRGLLSSSHLLVLFLSICVCFIFPLYTSSEDCIQTHGFNWKHNVELWLASPLLIHTLCELSWRSPPAVCTAYASGPLAWQGTVLPFRPHFMAPPYLVTMPARAPVVSSILVFRTQHRLCTQTSPSSLSFPSLHVHQVTVITEF